MLWRIARIYPIFKGGEETNVNNYRGVSVLDIGYKIMAGIMNKRLTTWIEENNKIKESQAGLRGERGTKDHIFTLNSIIWNKLKRKKGRLYSTFVDFKTAFDTIDRKIMIEKLEKEDIKGRYLRWVKKIYEETWCEVITKEAVSRRFSTSIGVRLGCPLSPTLFNIFIEDIDEMWEKTNTGGTVIGKKKDILHEICR